MPLSNKGNLKEEMMKTISAGMMKKWVVMACVLSLLLPQVMACDGVKPPPPLKVSFGAVMNNPEGFRGKLFKFEEGVVVFKKQKEGTSVVIVTTYPLPRIQSKDDLTDNDIMAIKVHSQDYGKVKIGSKVSALGYIESTEKKGKRIFYVAARDLTVTGQESIEDPDFSFLADAINQKVKDDDFFDLMFMFFFILPGPMNLFGIGND